MEYPFYLVTGFATVRERLAGPALPALLLAATVVPYLACCAGAIPFQGTALLRLAALALALSLWYRVLPPAVWADAAFWHTRDGGDVQNQKLATLDKSIP